MKSLAFFSAAAGVAMLGLAATANAAPISSGLPGLAPLSASNGAVEQVQYWRHRHHRCHWVKRCGPYRCWWVRRCW